VRHLPRERFHRPSATHPAAMRPVVFIWLNPARPLDAGAHDMPEAYRVNVDAWRQACESVGGAVTVLDGDMVRAAADGSSSVLLGCASVEPHVAHCTCDTYRRVWIVLSLSQCAPCMWSCVCSASRLSSAWSPWATCLAWRRSTEASLSGTTPCICACVGALSWLA
jgi:hypothetical protein